jgi:hypothetical protein
MIFFLFCFAGRRKAKCFFWVIYAAFFLPASLCCAQRFVLFCFAGKKEAGIWVEVDIFVLISGLKELLERRNLDVLRGSGCCRDQVKGTSVVAGYR